MRWKTIYYIYCISIPWLVLSMKPRKFLPERRHDKMWKCWWRSKCWGLDIMGLIPAMENIIFSGRYNPRTISAKVLPSCIKAWLRGTLKFWHPETLTFLHPNSLISWHPDNWTFWHHDYLKFCILTLWHSDILTLWHPYIMLFWYPEILNSWYPDILTSWLWHPYILTPPTSLHHVILISWHL